jgi:single-stranded DNA-binding protein
MNSVVLVGNIAGDIYTGTHNGRSLLRLLLLSGRPRLISGLRIVLLDGKGKEFYTALRKGSEIGVIGHLTTRRHERSFVSEVEVRNLILLRNYSWADIETQGTIIEQGGGKAFIQGTIKSEILFEWRQRKTGKFVDVNDRYAFLQFDLFNKIYPDGLTIVAYGFVAELIFPYLHPSSDVAINGFLRQDKRGRWAVVAENVALLRNIDYIKAAAANQGSCKCGRSTMSKKTSEYLCQMESVYN